LEKCVNNVSLRYRATDLPECRAQCAAAESYYQTSDTEFVCIDQCSNSIANTRTTASSPYQGLIYTQITGADGTSSDIQDATAVALSGLNKKCTASCTYAYEEYSGVKLCVNKCSATKYLTKDADDKWVCANDCADSKKFYFVNSNSDKECAPLSNDTDGCKFVDGSNNTVHKLTTDNTNVTQLFYHIVDPNVSTKRICKKTCTNPYFQQGNHLCLDNCKAINHFKETTKTIGENGVDQTTNNYSQCSVDKCMSDTYFRIELVTLDNMCMDSCTATGLDTFSLKKSVSRLNNGQTMHQCV
jgi:hypothetical protein